MAMQPRDIARNKAQMTTRNAIKPVLVNRSNGRTFQELAPRHIALSRRFVCVKAFQI